MTDVHQNDDRRKAVLEEKRNVSSKISELSRYIGFGLVAVVYTILTSDSEPVMIMYKGYTFLLLVVAVLGAATIILDYLQFVGGYLAVDSALKNVNGGYRYNDKSFCYRVRVVAFWLKQGTAFAGAFTLMIVIALSALHA